MLNLGVGTETTIGGRNYILTREGARGHAIYGPYQLLEPGRYVVEFVIQLPEGAPDEDAICAWIEVVSELGAKSFADDMVRTPQLTGGQPIRLAFELSAPTEVEYRVLVNGGMSLLVADSPMLSDSPVEVKAYPRPAFMIEQRGMVHGIFAMGGKVEVIDGYVVGELKGVRFNARTYDDVNFVREIFVLGAYNLLTAKPTCVIDVGMNVALSALLFATKDFVKEVHAFEPFTATYERGMRNIALNPGLASKIEAHNFGLSEQDGEVTLRIHDTGDSGLMSTRDSGQGTPMQVDLRDAGPALRPIIDSASTRGLDVIVKVDCEGSEFPVFESLERAGLLKEVRGFMVEWHPVFPGRNQSELIAPLLANGYLVFDVSPPEGDGMNGFFYAVRTN